MGNKGSHGKDSFKTALLLTNNCISPPMRVVQQANGLCTYYTSSDRLLDFFPFNSMLASLKLANNLNLCNVAN